MTRRRIAIASALLFAVALGTWLAWPTQTAPRPANATAAAVSGTPEHPVVAPAEEFSWRRFFGVAEAEVADAGPRAPALHVTVVSARTGSPIAGARVVLRGPLPLRGHYLHHAARPYDQAVSGADGVAVLHYQAEEGEEVNVDVSCAFFVSKSAPFTEGMTVALEALPALNGRVLNGKGEPVAGARVTTTRYKLTTFSDGSGRFTLAPPDSEWLHAEKDGAWGSGAWSGEEKTAEVVIALDDTRTEHRVVDRQGQPLAKVGVDFQLGAFPIHFQTDAAGRWTMGKLAARPQVTFTLPGFALEAAELDLSGAGVTTVLTRTSRIVGVLVTPEGTPVAGAEVLASSTEEGRSGILAQTVTDGDGRFALEGIGALEVVLDASFDGRDAETTLEIPEGDVVQVRLVLRPASVEVQLEVVDARDVAVDVWDYEAVASPVPDQGWVRRAALGVLPLSKGRFHVVVSASDGKVTGEVTVDLDPKEDGPPIHIKLNGVVEPTEPEVDAPPTHTFKVRVRGPTGVPVGGVEVECWNGTAVTREDGLCECNLSPPEDAWPIQVRARKGTDTGMTRAVGTETEVEVVLRPSHTIRGHIDGALPPGPCELALNSATEMMTFPISTNTFALEGRSTVRGFLCLTCQGKRETDGETVLGCAVAEGEGEVVIPIGAPGTLTVKVLDSTGKPVEHPIFYIDRHAEDLEAPAGDARTAVAPGTHILVINVGNKRERAELPFTIRPGETTALGTVQLK